MEFAGLICLILVVAALIHFRKSTARVASYAEDFITVGTSEAKVELTRRTNSIAEQLKDVGPYRIKDLDDLFASSGMDVKSKPSKEDKDNK